MPTVSDSRDGSAAKAASSDGADGSDGPRRVGQQRLGDELLPRREILALLVARLHVIDDHLPRLPERGSVGPIAERPEVARRLARQGEEEVTRIGTVPLDGASSERDRQRQDFAFERCPMELPHH